jgi:hypothetical protein
MLETDIESLSLILSVKKSHGLLGFKGIRRQTPSLDGGGEGHINMHVEWEVLL